MSASLLLLLTSAYIASAVPLIEDGVSKEYPRFINFPDGEGNLHLVDLEAEPDHEILMEIERNPTDNRYILYTRRNPFIGQTLVMNNADSIRNSNFDSSLPTAVLAHGWLSNQNTINNPVIRDALLRRNNVNVIVIDWRRLALSDYVTAVRGVPAVGRGLGQFINFLIQTTGANLNRFHIIGFSLGAHLAGNAGRELGGRAARVTGLDPAGPLWHYNVNRLRRTDGVYVEAIHTDGGSDGLGIGSAIANADFFPNGGETQPGCSTRLCNHNRAWELFASSVTYNRLIGNLCLTTQQIASNTCRGRQLHLGNDDLTKSGSGMYRVNARARYPYF